MQLCHESVGRSLPHRLRFFAGGKGRAATAASAGENEPARSQIMRDTNSLNGPESNNALNKFYTVDTSEKFKNRTDFVAY